MARFFENLHLPAAAPVAPAADFTLAAAPPASASNFTMANADAVFRPVDYTQCCSINCDFCFGFNATKDCVECCLPFTTGRALCCKPNTDCWKRCCSKVVPVFGFGGFLLCKECRELMNGCAGCLENAGEACSAECIQFKTNIERAIERRRLRQEREAQERLRLSMPPMAANSMSVTPPPVARLGGKKYKSRGLRRRKSKSKLSGLIRRKSKSKSRGLRRRKTMTSRG